jgi:hypothetical protein
VTCHQTKNKNKIKKKEKRVIVRFFGRLEKVKNETKQNIHEKETCVKIKMAETDLMI